MNLSGRLTSELPAIWWNNVKVMKQRWCKNHWPLFPWVGNALGFMIGEKTASQMVSWCACCHHSLFGVMNPDWKMSLSTLDGVQKEWKSPIPIAGLSNPANRAVQECLFFCSSLKHLLWNCNLKFKLSSRSVTLHVVLYLLRHCKQSDRIICHINHSSVSFSLNALLNVLGGLANESWPLHLLS